MKNLSRPNATVIPNEFIDNLMAGANGEYVKVYLYLMRHSGEELTDEQIADALDLTSGDISRALAYWSRQGVMETGQDSGQPAPADEVRKKTSVDITRLRDDSEFSELLYCLQKYLSRIFSQTEMETVAYLYDVLKMPRELIEYLAELCIQKGKTSMHYLEAIARDWHEKGITTVEDARRDSGLFAAETFGVMKAFGINDRMPAPSEAEYIDRWFKTCAFPADIVAEACRRTIDTIGKPSFRYADSILTRWMKEGVRTLADVERLDKEHEARKAAAQERPENGQAKRAVGSNFEQRKDDLDSRMLDRINDRLK